MVITVGMASIGKVRAAGTDYIETVFFFFILPIFPVRSLYFTGELTDPFSIPFFWQSIILGYLRYVTLALIVIQTTRTINLVFAAVDPYYALFHFWTGEALPTATTKLRRGQP